MNELKTASFEGKDTFKMPPKESIIKKSFNLTIEEIENGFILRKSYDIKYKDESGETQYEYFTKKWFSEDNPMQIDESKVEESLADKFD